jgi:hypothetical protein
VSAAVPLGHENIENLKTSFPDKHLEANAEVFTYLQKCKLKNRIRGFIVKRIFRETTLCQ